MSNYGDTDNGAARQGRHRRMDRYMEQEAAPRQNREVPQADPYARPESNQASTSQTRTSKNVYDGYERPDENYLKSDEALLSRRSRSFTRSAQNSDEVQTRMTQTGYQQTVRQQQRPAYQSPYSARATRPAAEEAQPNEQDRMYQRPAGRTNQRPSVNTATPARVRPVHEEEEELEEEQEGGLSGTVKIVLAVVLVLVLFCAGIYFFLPEGNSGVIGGLNQIKSGITGVVNRVGGLIRPTEAPAQVLSFSCANPTGQIGETCKFNMTTTQNVTSVGLCDQNGDRITSSVTYANDLSDNGRVWELSVTFSQPYDSLVFASIQQGNNVWITSNQSVQVAYQAASSVAAASAGTAEEPVIIQQLTVEEPLGTDLPEEMVSEQQTEEPFTEQVSEQASAAATVYVVSAQTPGPAQPSEAPTEQTGVFVFSAATPLPEDPDAPSTDAPVQTKEPVQATKEPVVTATPAPAKPTAEPLPTITPMPQLTAEASASLQTINSVYIGGKQQRSYTRDRAIMALNPDQYSYWAGGVFTFRGDNFRRNAAFGTAEIAEDEMSILWSKEMGSIKTSSGTLYGMGWTGQPAIIKWAGDVRNMMNIYPEKKETSGLREVIFASQDGNVYFVDLKDGTDTRDPIAIGYPLKGSVSVYTQAAPLISFGQGVSKLAGGKTGAIGHYLYNLLDGSRVMFLNGRQSNDQKQYTTNGAFDGTSLMIQDPTYSKAGDMIIAGENGLLYTVHINTSWTEEALDISVDDPVYLMSKAKKSEDNRVGIESSVAMYNQYVFMADSYGALRCVDTNTMTTVWAVDLGDNTDAAIALDFDENGKLWLYTGNTNAYRLVKKDVSIRRINAMTGEIDWTYGVSCVHDKTEMSGCKASPVIGQHSIDHLVIFTVNQLTEGGSKIVALEKATGNVIWDYKFNAEAVSSPVAVYNQAGDAFIIQADQSGVLHMFEARSGVHLSQLDLGGEILGSPAVYRDILVIGTCSRDNAKLYGIQLK